jgi:Asp-tRNA(Asn)/Glu-tRNA(Gln) amidotransferase A subunit family amidase
MSSIPDPEALDPEAAVETWREHFEEREPEVEAFLPEPGRFERLRREARELKARYPDPDARPPLYGVPVGVKDMFAIAGQPRRAGTSLPPEEFASDEAGEAYAVRRLRDAGALVFGRTVSTELAYFAPGPTRNPHDPAHTPGGSSSGSAAAVGAGMVPLALGTQTIGSVIRPAAYCGVAGFKPTYDRVPRTGLVPLASSYDHVGWMARDPELATTAARVLVNDWNEPGPTPSPLRLAVPEGPYLDHLEDAARESFRATLDALEAAGVEIVVVPALGDIREIELRHRELLAYEFAAAHWDLYTRHGGAFHTRTAALLERGRRISPERAAAVRAMRGPLGRHLDGLLAAHDAHAWVAPSAPGPAPAGLDSTGDPILNLPWSQAGLPSLSLPSGRVDGLPVGLQLVGPFGGDEALLALGRAVHRHLPSPETGS